MTRPGARLRSLAQRVCDPSTMERLIDPVIADLQCEHAEALRRGQVWRSRWIRIAGYVAFLKVAAMTTTTGSTRAMRDWAAADDHAVGRTILFSLAAMAVTVALLVWVPLSHASYSVSRRIALLILYLVPQALSVGVPMGLVFGVLCGMRGRVVTPRVRRAITILLLACSLAVLVIAGWVLPATNQAYRELLFGGPVSKGMNELTLGELRHREQRSVIPTESKRLEFEFHFRLALAFAPLVLGLFTLGVATARHGTYGWFAIGLMASATCCAYYLLLFSARALSDRLPAAVAGWIPNLVFLAMALLLLRQRGGVRPAPTAARASGG